MNPIAASSSVDAGGMRSTGPAGVSEPVATRARRPDTPERVATAAREFEALMIAEMMKSMRPADGGGWTGGDEDQTSSAVMELAGEQMARALADKGGLGLAKLVTQGLGQMGGGTRQARLGLRGVAEATPEPKP